uniref:dynein axonemal heavy chain 5-like n=1 Tax=Callithrix jacchus TaxID=9483 RepID=UPI0023DD0B18|nr:dynein axonemal heavy chain 5-like [Callithrix jacchus]
MLAVLAAAKSKLLKLSMMDAIPTLINAIKMIYSISHYYNTSEKITSLFVKEYQHCFHKTKQKLKQDPNAKQFDFSEMYILGKFETFHQRLAKVIDIFTILRTYSVLQDSTIEGLEDIVTKYQDIVATIKKKEYNFLDQRKMDFDQDYEEFCKQTSDLFLLTVMCLFFPFCIMLLIITHSEGRGAFIMEINEVDVLSQLIVRQEADGEMIKICGKDTYLPTTLDGVRVVMSPGVLERLNNCSISSERLLSVTWIRVMSMAARQRDQSLESSPDLGFMLVLTGQRRQRVGTKWAVGSLEAC